MHDGLFHLRSHPILQNRLLPRNLLEGRFAAGLIQLLKAVEAISAIAHLRTGFRHVAELLRQFQHPYLRLDDLLLRRHRPHSFPEGENSARLSDEVLAVTRNNPFATRVYLPRFAYFL